jgi:hypothetical protein
MPYQCWFATRVAAQQQNVSDPTGPCRCVVSLLLLLLLMMMMMMMMMMLMLML